MGLIIRCLHIGRINLDEVYQAALAAGSGGIRWNSSTNWIQLMDENKNWINWKQYFKDHTIIQLFTAVGSYTHTVIEDGLYLAMATSNGSASVTTNGGNTIQTYNIDGNGTGYAKFIKCTEGNTISASSSGNAYCCSLFFLRGYNNIVGVASMRGVANNATTTYEYTDNYANFMFGMARCTGVFSVTNSYEGDIGRIYTGTHECSFAVQPTSSYCNFSIYTSQYGGGFMGYAIIE